MHEVVLSARSLRAAHGVKAVDVAKRLLDEGFHAPTVYFPLIVEEALMIEPTETESPTDPRSTWPPPSSASRPRPVTRWGRRRCPSTRCARRSAGWMRPRAARQLMPTFDARPA